jgi:hypothetical protein
MTEEKRIYVVVAGTIQVPVYAPIADGFKQPLRTVVQPMGRQIAQACHAVSKLRFTDDPTEFVEPNEFYPRTTIILQARDSAEMFHVYVLLCRKRLNPVIFSDNNPEYGPGNWPTAIAVYGTPKQIQGVLDYLPLWGSK